MQGPSHAESQQTPDTQKPDAHSSGRRQVCSGPKPQRPPGWQGLPAQSASITQWSRHCAVAGSHVYGVQIRRAPTRQAPLPSHTLAPTTVSPSQKPSPQGVFSRRKRQRPTPSHVPSLPQVSATSTGQAPGRGGRPDGTDAQVPTIVVRSQRTHGPMHSALQQTPSVQ